MPSIIAAGILGAGGVASGLIGANAAESAANTQAGAASQAAQSQLQAAQLAANTQLGIYNQTRSDLAPYLSTGTSALQQLASLFGFGPGGSGPTAGTASAATSALQNYPGYQFGLSQGVQALDRSAASRGLVLSGAQLKDAQTFGQGYAMQNAWQPYVSNLAQAASLGESAGSITGNAGTWTGNAVGNTITGGANAAAASNMAGAQATAAGIVGSSNALTSGLQSGLNNSMLAYLLSNGGYGAGLQGAINSGATMGVSNGGYNYIDAMAS